MGWFRNTESETELTKSKRRVHHTKASVRKRRANTRRKWRNRLLALGALGAAGYAGYRTLHSPNHPNNETNSDDKEIYVASYPGELLEVEFKLNKQGVFETNHVDGKANLKLINHEDRWAIIGKGETIFEKTDLNNKIEGDYQITQQAIDKFRLGHPGLKIKVEKKYQI